MTKEDLLEILKVDLNQLCPSTVQENYMGHLLDGAVERIAREGIKLEEPYSPEDGMLIERYAAYLYRKRATSEPMPRDLRWALNNRLFSEKAKGGGDNAP